MTEQPYIVVQDRWTEDNKVSRRATARPVWRTNPQGERVPGIGIFKGNFPRVILSPEDALRVATGIADSLAQARDHQ